MGIAAFEVSAASPMTQQPCSRRGLPGTATDPKVCLSCPRSRVEHGRVTSTQNLLRPLAVYPAPAGFNLGWISQAGLTGSCNYLGLLVWSYVTLLPVSPIRRLAPSEPYA